MWAGVGAHDVGEPSAHLQRTRPCTTSRRAL